MPARLLLAVLLTGAFAAPAVAQEPLPGDTWIVPQDGASRPASSWPDATPFEMIEFTVYVDDYEEEVHAFDVEVSRSPALDPDGTLADAGRVDAYVAAPRETSDEIFSARTSLAAQWLSVPGPYYWQAHYLEDDELYATPVRRLTITPRAVVDPPALAPVPPPPPVASASAPAAIVPAPLAASTVRRIVRRAIVRATRRTAERLRYRCVSLPGGTATCHPSWRDARSRNRGTLRIRSGLAGISASFTGTSVARSCARRCTRAVEWSTSL